MARSTFYYHLKQLKFPDKYKQEKNEIVSIYHDHKGRYGYRRITVEMHNRGYSINHKTVLRLMNECGVKCQVRLKKYRSYKGEVGAVVPDLLKRNFMAERPNQKWVTDLTEFSLFGKKLYLSPIMDLYNREIISYNIAEHPTFYQTMKMLEDAIKDLPDAPELILHSDQGWQYQMKRYQYRLREKGISQSMFAESRLNRTQNRSALFGNKTCGLLAGSRTQGKTAVEGIADLQFEFSSHSV